MPIYEYQCPRCGTLEVFQRITDSPLGRCPTCRSKVTKLISRSSFQLKGTGWYATDYAATGRNGTRHGGAEEAASKGDSKSDSTSSSSNTGRSSAPSSSSPKASPDTKTADKRTSVGSEPS
jgi:putative FmdB family regulatory protein